MKKLNNVQEETKKHQIAKILNLNYISYYQSPIGNMLLSANTIGLNGLWFEGQKIIQSSHEQYQEKEIALFKQVKTWLDIYFLGKKPNFSIPLYLIGTKFQKEIWQILCGIPYGQTTTYGEIAKQLAKKRGIVRMSAQAVGGAVGRNNIAILIPCHRVIGVNGSLVGYAGGLDKKTKLLKLEKVIH